MENERRDDKEPSAQFFLVDVFAARRFTGVPVPVFWTSNSWYPDLMLSLTQEVGLPDAAFVHPVEGGFRCRVCTPNGEVDFSVRAVLAVADVVSHLVHGQETSANVSLLTGHGWLTVRTEGGWCLVDLPLDPESPESDWEPVETSLRAKAQYVGRSSQDLLVEVATEAELRTIKPDLQLVAGLPCRGVIVTSRSDSGPYDFVTRFFAPRAGLNEDAVTGSAFRCLGPFWQKKLNKQDLVAYQASQRGGEVHVRVFEDRVAIGGRVTNVLVGVVA